MAKLTNAEVQAIQAKLLPIKSKRMKILTALKYLLETITTSRGYLSNIYEVSFDVKSWKDRTESQTPIAYIIDDETRIIKHAGCVREYEWTIRIFGQVRDKTITEFEEFIADIEQCVYDNNSLFGECNLMWVSEITTDNQFFSEIAGVHFFEITLIVAYTRRFDNPR
jgi:hypothetical protein